MEPTKFERNHCYKVFFEKDIPIEFKYLETKTNGAVVCQTREGKQFNFQELPQYLSIRKVYPER